MKFTRRNLLGTTLALSAQPLFAKISLAEVTGGTLSIGLTTALAKLDPIRTNTGDEYIYSNSVFNGLTRILEDLTTAPDLAESWSSSQDLKQWTFNLRKGVKFHHGRELEADDVVTFFKRLIDPESVATTRSDYIIITNVSALDRYTVRFDLSIPYSGFADIMGGRQAKITPREQSAEEIQKHPIGTGPFMFESNTLGDRMVLVRNPNYFEPGLPKLDRVVLRILPEPSVKIAALKSGDIDIIWNLPLEQIKPLSKEPGLRVESVTTGSFDAVIMNNEVAPFDDVRVRRAFQIAVDKRDVAELTLFGQGGPIHSPIPPNSPFFASELPFNTADPATARKLLAEAGHPDGLSLDIIVPEGRTIRERLGVTLQQLAKPAGFDLSIKKIPMSAYGAEVTGKAPFFVDGYFARPTTDTQIYPFVHSSGGSNYGHYKNAAVDAALDKARQSSKFDEQRAAYVEVQSILDEVPAGFYAYSVNYACAYSKSVMDVKTHPMLTIDLRHASKA